MKLCRDWTIKREDTGPDIDIRWLVGRNREAISELDTFRRTKRRQAKRARRRFLARLPFRWRR